MIYHRYTTDIPHISLLITSWYNPKTQVDYTLPSFVAQQGSLNGSTDRGSTCPRWNPSHHPFLGPNWRKNIRESSTDQTWHKLWTCFFSCMDIPKMDGIPKTNIISKWAELYNLLQPYYLQLVIVDHSPKSQNIQIRKPHCRNGSTSKDTFHQVAKIFVLIIYEDVLSHIGCHGSVEAHVKLQPATSRSHDDQWVSCKLWLVDPKNVGPPVETHYPLVN